MTNSNQAGKSIDSGSVLCPGPRQLEKLLTIREVSAALNVPLFAMRRAVKAGFIPAYTIGNRRLRLRMTEVLAAIETTRKGGCANG